MNTVKNIFKPGGNKDDDVMYGSDSKDPNQGKISGEGTHFPKHKHADSGVEVASPTSPESKRTFPLTNDTTGQKSSVSSGSHPTTTTQPPWPLKDTSAREERILEEQQDTTNKKADGSAPKYAHDIPGDLEGPVHKSKILNDLDPRVKEHPGSATTGGHHSVPKVGESHHGHSHDTKDTAAAGAGVSDSEPHHASQVPGDLEGPVHKSKILNDLDPRVKDHPGSATTGGHHTVPKVGETHHDNTARDVAVGAGAGTGAATAVREGEKFYDAPQGSGTQTISQPTVSQPTTTDGHGVSYRTLDPKADSTYSNQTTTEPPSTDAGVPILTSQQPTGHSSALKPGAAGAATGIGESAQGPPVGEHLGQPGIAQRSAEQHHATGPALTQSEAARTHADQSSTPQTQTKQPKQEEGHHYGRDAAIAGGAGAAGAYGAHELEKHEKEQQKAQEQAQKEIEKQHKQAEKEAEKQHKQAEKEAEKEQKQAEKDAKKHEKEQEKANKEAQKEAEKRERKEHEALVAEQKQAEKDAKKAQKEAEKEQKKQEKEEKPGLVDRLLGRNKDKDDEHEKHKHEAEGAAAGAAAGAGAGAVAHERGAHHDTTGIDGLPITQTEQQASTTTGPDVPARKSSVRNRLHKDPPAGYAEAPSKGYASQVTGGTGTTALAQGDDDVPTVPGTRYGSGSDEHKYHEGDPSQGVKHTSAVTAGGTVTSTTPMAPAPQSGYASQVTGGTGTTQLAQGDREPITNPRKDDPLHEGPKGYAAQVTGGTGTTQLAKGTNIDNIPTDKPGEIAGVQSETPYVDGSKGGYASQVTGGTGTTQLAKGDQDPVVNPDPHHQSIAEKAKEVLHLK